MAISAWLFSPVLLLYRAMVMGMGSVWRTYFPFYDLKRITEPAILMRKMAEIAR